MTILGAETWHFQHIQKGKNMKKKQKKSLQKGKKSKAKQPHCWCNCKRDNFLHYCLVSNVISITKIALWKWKCSKTLSSVPVGEWGEESVHNDCTGKLTKKGSGISLIKRVLLKSNYILTLQAGLIGSDSWLWLRKNKRTRKKTQGPVQGALVPVFLSLFLFFCVQS